MSLVCEMADISYQAKIKTKLLASFFEQEEED